jgi:hypothetical protein
MSNEVAGPDGSALSEGLGVFAQPPAHWIPVAVALPEMDVPVWLYEPSRGIWVGARGDTGDGWLWGNTYGSHYHATTTGGKGYWRCHDNDADDDYSPTFWMALPEPPPDA